MTTSSVEKNEYEGRIGKLQREDLFALWQKIRQRLPTGWPPGRAFEYLILRAFELEGAKVRYPFVVRWGSSESDGGWAIEQIDGAIHLEGLHALVETKDELRLVNGEPIAKLRNQLLRRPGGTVGVCFSTRGFTAPARLLANMTAPQTVLLWSGLEVDTCFRDEPSQRPFIRVLRHKHQVAIETGLGDSEVVLTQVPP